MNNDTIVLPGQNGTGEHDDLGEVDLLAQDEPRGLATLDDLFAAAAITEKHVPVQALGGQEIVIRGLNQSEIDTIFERSRTKPNRTTGELEHDEDKAQIYFVAASLVQPKLSVAQAQTLYKKSYVLWQELVLIIYRANRLGTFSLRNDPSFRIRT